MKKLLALMLCVCMVFGTFAMTTVSAATENRNIAPESIVETATDGYGDNDAANMFDGDLETYYMAGRVTDADGAELSTSSSNTVWVKLAEHEKITRIEATFGSKADRTALFGNGGNQNQNFYLYLTDFGPDEATFDGTNGIVVPEGKTATRITNGFSNQSSYSSMKKDVTEEAEYTYLALWGPYSAGLCLSELKIFADAEEKEVVLPPGAITQIVEKQITPLDAGFTANAISNAANEGSNIIDGSEDTMAIVDGYANHLYVDLGKAYNVTKIEIVTPDADAITAFVTSNGIVTDSVASMNLMTQVFVSDTLPSGTTNTRINGEAGIAKGAKITYTSDGYTNKGTALKDLGDIRYVSVTQGTSSNPTAVAEIRVYGMVEEIISGDLVQVNKNVATEKYGTTAGFGTWGYSAFNYSNAGYEASKVLDSDPTTLGLGAHTYNDGNNHYSDNILIVDLGQKREVTKLKLTWPTKENYSAAKVAIGSKMTNDMNQSGVIFLTNSYPVSKELSGTTYSGEGVTLFSGPGIAGQKTLTNADGNSYRYVCIFVPYSCGIAISDVEVFANIMEEAAPAVSVNVAKDKMVYSTANNAETLGEPKHFTYEMNAVDGKVGTVFAGGVYYIDDDIVEATGEMKDTTCNFETVVDLGDKYLISSVKLNPYGGGTTSIYGSNSEKFNDLEVIAENVATTDGEVLEYTDINKEYRYIYVDRIGSKVNEILGIREIEAYTELDEDSVAAATKDNRGVKVNLNKEVLYTGDIRWETNPESLVDGKYDYSDSITQTFILSPASGQRNYVVVDLGEAYKISGVGMTQPYDCSGFANTGWTVVATNDDITAETMADANWVTLASNCSFVNTSSTDILPMRINAASAYRYVGILGCSGMGMPFRELDIYASAAGYDFGTYTAYASGNDVAVEFTSDDAAGSDSAEILIASYDADGALIKIVSETFEIDWTNGGAGSDLYEDAIAEGAETAKVFIIDPASTMSPLANCITL